MKEIFNSIRNKASQCSDKACFMPDDTEVITESRLKQILDEAEAKWEAEVCEWKRAEWNPKYVINSPHKDCMPLSIADLNKHPYCGHCGKPIKISEVE